MSYFQYFIPVILLWSSQLTFLIVFPVVKNQLYNMLDTLAKSSLVMYGEAESEEQNLATFLWNLVMVHLECCGVTSHQDFQLSQRWNEHKEKFQVRIKLIKYYKATPVYISFTDIDIKNQELCEKIDHYSVILCKVLLKFTSFSFNLPLVLVGNF